MVGSSAGLVYECVCVYVLACECVLCTHAWICVFLLVGLHMCVHVCLSSYLTVREPLQECRKKLTEIVYDREIDRLMDTKRER